MSTTLGQYKAAIVRNRARIIDLLRWDNDTLTNFIYNTGLIYLDCYIGKDPDNINHISSRKEFWSWWENLFNNRDEAFIWEWDGFENQATTEDLRKIYKDFNNPAVLACELKMPPIVYGENYTHLQLA
ncbi:MAG: hypothetical protein ACT4OJ_04285 [Bacteroidota bacterium]